MTLDVRFPKQKNRRVIFQCGDRARLKSEHVVLFTATLPPQIRPKIGRKSCMENVLVIRPLKAWARYISMASFTEKLAVVALQSLETFSLFAGYNEIPIPLS
ncbi:uncharacterized protein TNCV_1954301 [Trichonephila clavipes]|nr:uncharacterized protein TNCV_1954301 [Trichonephila clavipes]